MRTIKAELNPGWGSVLQVSSAANGNAPISVEQVLGGAKKDLPGSTNEPVLSSKANVLYLPVTVSLSEALRLAAERGIPSTAEQRYHYEPALGVRLVFTLPYRT